VSTPSDEQSESPDLLKKTRMALDIMGKAHALLEELSESAENDAPPTRS